MQPLSSFSSALPGSQERNPQIGVGLPRNSSSHVDVESPGEVESAPEASGDRASFSGEGLRALAQEGPKEESPGSASPTAESVPQGDGAAPSEGELSEQERAQVRELAARDAEVRAHEQAHKAAAGDLASGAPSYEYEKGPDGKDYAVGGEVGISLSEGDSPEETLSRAQRIQRAAQAPANPSSQDRRVAAQAQQMANEARAEIQSARGAEEDSRSGSMPSSEGVSGGSPTANAVRAYSQTGASDTSAGVDQIPSLLDLFA